MRAIFWHIIDHGLPQEVNSEDDVKEYYVSLPAAMLAMISPTMGQIALDLSARTTQTTTYSEGQCKRAR
ncbi:hypothetical protein BH11PSE5_BH11PSE5_24340 [soil metagenome]|tara:strand:+ start:936 stop:1142 length:207 start_codon:yes stop_codon:yes gene_type:complete